MLRTRQRLGKYRIERRLAEGGFAAVYRAFDTIEGVRVALKIPHARLVTPEVMEDFRREVRLGARLDHANILPVKDASVIKGVFVIVFPLGQRSLDDRLRSRITLESALEFADQMLSAAAFAHQHRVIHCDIKPDNLILFPQGRLRLTDFGVSRVAQKTIKASGSGTLGYTAPEQAMGRPSLRSDVFALGLVLYRMFSGRLPEWPYDWPPPGYDRLRRRLHPQMIALIRRAIEIQPRKRFRDAGHMLAAFRRIKSRALRYAATHSRRTKKRPVTRDWKQVRWQQFKRQYGTVLGTRLECRRCEGPVSEQMRYCPWCGAKRRTHRDRTDFPKRCPRCGKGVKSDWKYCPWCYGAGFKKISPRNYTDVRYVARCSNPKCLRKELMPFMRYCPWCRRLVKRKWKVPGSNKKCLMCGWGIVGEFWAYCPWCGCPS